jgi:hypothetical protein
LQFVKSPFFGILITNPSSHSSGIFSSFHIFSSRGYSTSTVFSGSTLSTSNSLLLDLLPSFFLIVSRLAVFQFL